MSLQALLAVARPDAAIVAVIGAGRQAASHLEAAAVVRNLREVRVHSRHDDRCRSFAHQMTRKLGLSVLAQNSARDAVEGADIVLLATTSLRPVIRAEWLSQGVFVHTVGFKSPTGKEMGLDVAERAELLATDSPAQVAAAGDTFILHGTIHLGRVKRSRRNSLNEGGRVALPAREWVAAHKGTRRPPPRNRKQQPTQGG